MSISVQPEFLGLISASPGVCWLCNVSRRRSDVVVDLGKNIHMEGWVQICSTCGGDIAANIGWIAPDKADDLRAEITDLLADNQALQRRAEIAEAALAALRTYDEASA